MNAVSSHETHDAHENRGAPIPAAPKLPPVLRSQAKDGSEGWSESASSWPVHAESEFGAPIRRKGKCSLKIKGSDSRRPVGGSGAKRIIRRRSHGQHQLAASGDLLVGNPASRDGFAVERGGLDAGIFAGIIFRDDRE